MTSIALRAALLAAVAMATTITVDGAAVAADPAPVFSGCGKAVKDLPTDASDTVSDPAPREAEIEGAFVEAGAAKPTVNLIIADLTGSAPAPATSVTYNAIYSATAGTTNFVRAHIDFTGTVVFEYGHLEDLTATTRYVYDGDTEGKLFTGEHGVVQLVIPEAAGGKAGTALKAITAQTQVGRTTVVPGSTNQSPSRGLSFQNDDAAIGTVTLGPCAPDSAPSTPAPAAATTVSTTPTTQGTGALKVSLVTKKVKVVKPGKSVTLKLKASSPLTAVGLRISKGSKVYGTAKASKVKGTTTIKVRVAKGLKKGTYALDVAGTDSAGKRGIASFKLKVS